MASPSWGEEMGSNWIKAPLFTVLLVALFGWAGEVITRASGAGSARPLAEGVSVANGEQIFWGSGKCHTCHSVGTRGSTVRCPNLGESDQGAPIALRAVERARARGAELGREMSVTEYLVESIATPSAYVVEGFKDEMPRVFAPPISLGPDEITSVILYLQTLGGTPDPSAIVLPAELRAARRHAQSNPWAPYLAGDSLRGRTLFFDVDGPAPCAKCHTVADDGGAIGPDLTSVAGTRTAQFIVESILEPDAEIASGYEATLIQTTNGLILDGVVQRETSDSIWLATAEGNVIALAMADVARRRTQEVSIMPGNFAEVLTVTDLHDLLAFLQTLQ